jgi:hypothetical protein
MLMMLMLTLMLLMKMLMLMMMTMMMSRQQLHVQLSGSAMSQPAADTKSHSLTASKHARPLRHQLQALYHPYHHRAVIQLLISFISPRTLTKHNSRTTT